MEDETTEKLPTVNAIVLYTGECNAYTVVYKRAVHSPITVYEVEGHTTSQPLISRTLALVVSTDYTVIYVG